MKQLARAIVSGEVQGVGFRYFILGQSRKFAVLGFVKNLADGAVEIQAEGERGEVEKFLESCKGGGFHRVERLEVEWKPAGGKFKSFEIRR
ncbi:MAG: acylphosphatase [Candidatus Micrarchaeota archaeon]